MNKRILSVIIAIMMALTMIPAAVAENASMDPFEEITDEFNQAVTVEPYQVIVRPARITGWAALRWAPSHSAPLSSLRCWRMAVLRDSMKITYMLPLRTGR